MKFFFIFLLCIGNVLHIRRLALFPLNRMHIWYNSVHYSPMHIQHTSVQRIPVYTYTHRQDLHILQPFRLDYNRMEYMVLLHLAIRQTVENSCLYIFHN